MTEDSSIAAVSEPHTSIEQVTTHLRDKASRILELCDPHAGWPATVTDLVVPRDFSAVAGTDGEEEKNGDAWTFISKDVSDAYHEACWAYVNSIGAFVTDMAATKRLLLHANSTEGTKAR